MSSRLYSAVVDPVGLFPLQARHLLWSLTTLAGVAPDQIVLHVVNPATDSEVMSGLRNLGVEIVPVAPYPGHPYCNKLQQLPSLGQRAFHDVVLLDCDVLVLEEPPSVNRGATAKPVDFGNPPVEALQQIFDAAGLSLTLTTTDIDKKPTGLANANGGVYVIHHEVFKPLADEWRRWADWSLAHREMFGDKWIHIDQVSFSMAIASLAIPFTELDRRFNVPTHVPQPYTLDCDPAILHYHRAVNEQQLLLPVAGLPRINQAIGTVNQGILAQRRLELDNAAFWNARYSLHPGLGSGIGSRGTTLIQKQALLGKVVKIFGAGAILDIGSGDGLVVSALAAEVSITAVDLAASSRSLYLQAQPRALWRQHDITSGPVGVETDLVVCLDLLIHLASHHDYQAAVKNLLSHGAPVLVSGFDAPPIEFGPMTYYHEPLSSSLAAHGFAAVPIDGYRGLVVFVAMPPHPASGARDISNKTINDALGFVAHPLSLVEAVVRSRSTLGFFPDHLPRCIEYPWVIHHLPERRPLRILDAGAGVSVLPFLLADRGHVVITVDSHPLSRNGTPPEGWNEWGFLDYSQLDPRIRSIHAPYQDTGCDLQLDVVVSVSVIEHLPRKVRLEWLKTAFCQLVAGGWFLLTVDTHPFTSQLWNYSAGKVVEDGAVHGTIDDLVAEIMAVGFSVDLMEHLEWLPKSRVGMARIKASKPKLMDY